MNNFLIKHWRANNIIFIMSLTHSCVEEALQRIGILSVTIPQGMLNVDDFDLLQCFYPKNFQNFENNVYILLGKFSVCWELSCTCVKVENNLKGTTQLPLLIGKQMFRGAVILLRGKMINILYRRVLSVPDTLHVILKLSFKYQN